MTIITSHRTHKLKAFTLVEMLIVVVIIGILAAALIPRLIGAQAGARDTSRKTGLAQLGTALETYQLANSSYPGQPGCAGDTNQFLEAELVDTGELGSIPKDPGNTRTVKALQNAQCTAGSYGYSPLNNRGADSQGFILLANVEKVQSANAGLEDSTITTAQNGTSQPTKASILPKASCDKVVVGDPANNCEIGGAPGDINTAYYAYFSAS